MRKKTSQKMEQELKMRTKLKKSLDWFRHYTDAQDSVKVRLISKRFGWAMGYALFFRILEKLGRSDYGEVFWDQNTLEIWADDFGCEIDLLKEFVEFGLQERINAYKITDEGYLYSPKLKERHDKALESREKDRERKSLPKAPTSKKVKKDSKTDKLIKDFLEIVGKKHPSVKPAKSWNNACEKLLSEFSEDQLIEVFTYIIEHDFYRKVVQSPVKLLSQTKDGTRWIDKILGDLNYSEFANNDSEEQENPKATHVDVKTMGKIYYIPVSDLKDYLKDKPEDFKNQIIEKLGRYGYEQSEIESLV
jgi:hypothetical protein